MQNPLFDSWRISASVKTNEVVGQNSNFPRNEKGEFKHYKMDFSLQKFTKSV